MVAGARGTYRPRVNTAPESELDALARVYKFVLGCRAKKEGSPTQATLDNTRGDSKHDSRADKAIIPE